MHTKTNTVAHSGIALGLNQQSPKVSQYHHTMRHISLETKNRTGHFPKLSKSTLLLF